MQAIVTPYDCPGQHRYFVAETGFVEGENKVCVVIVCTACGDSKLITHIVTGTLHTVPKKEK